jgi:hypothetical protein
MMLANEVGKRNKKRELVSSTMTMTDDAMSKQSESGFLMGWSEHESMCFQKTNKNATLENSI